MHGGFTLDDATRELDYLAALGISHVYSSPYMQAAAGSTHGYDPVDWSAVNLELGGEPAHARFTARLKALGLGQILDIVPNHMALADGNRYWWDVLQNGQSSRYADYFDIYWNPDEARLRKKILVPVLGDQYGHELDKGAIQLARSGTRFEVKYYEHRLPVAPESMPAFLQSAAENCKSDALAFLSESFGRLSHPDPSDRAAVLDRDRDKTALFDLLEHRIEEAPDSIPCLDEAIAALNKNVDALDEFLQQQNYRLAYWRVAAQDLGYRRFFDVNTLIGVRVEREPVFRETHARVLKWLEDGTVDGVRVDHPDGLRDPQQYFDRLRHEAPNAYVVAEKILQKGEQLRESWPIQGATGYEFLNQVNGLLISPDGLRQLDEIYCGFTGGVPGFAEMAHEKKLSTTREALGSDVNRLTDQFLEICDHDRNHRDYTRADVRRALREIAASFPVYRTYVSPSRNEVLDEDAQSISTAVKAAQQRRKDVDPRLFAFIEAVLTLRRRGTRETKFLQRFQQFTSPVMAKGVEDTAFYCYNRLIALNEVGGNPGDPVVSVEDFHRLNQRAQEKEPFRMLTLTTHDTKRSEDTRARLLVLTESPEEFGEALKRWSAMNAKHNSTGLVDRNAEYYFYQTALGAWPLTAERAVVHMEKASREAKVHTSWVTNNADYEKALREFVEATLKNSEFTDDVQKLAKLLDRAARSNSLAQTLLKTTSPGVPDLYQGAELWDHRLVDPDNRTPVDFALRSKLLKELQTMDAPAVLARMDEGLPKLWTIAKALQVRNEFAQSFGADSKYTPLVAEGDRKDHVVAFLRGEDVAVIVPRLTEAVTNGWQGTTVKLPRGSWRNRLTGASAPEGNLKIETLLAEFPVALLVREN
jgi:(1->4)-alpha-D-glucan 1-alpha-D-glucosylmutase